MKLLSMHHFITGKNKKSVSIIECASGGEVKAKDEIKFKKQNG